MRRSAVATLTLPNAEKIIFEVRSEGGLLHYHPGVIRGINYSYDDMVTGAGEFARWCIQHRDLVVPCVLLFLWVDRSVQYQTANTTRTKKD